MGPTVVTPYFELIELITLYKLLMFNAAYLDLPFSPLVALTELVDVDMLDTKSQHEALRFRPTERTFALGCTLSNRTQFHSHDTHQWEQVNNTTFIPR